MKQLQVYNPNTGEWFDVGEQGANPGDVIMGQDAMDTYETESELSLEYPLTKIDAPLEWKLGGELLASVPGKYRDRVAAFAPPSSGQTTIDSRSDAIPYVWGSRSESSRIILRPKVPATKTTMEVLEDLVRVAEHHVASVIQPSTHHDVLVAAKKHIADAKALGK